MAGTERNATRVASADPITRADLRQIQPLQSQVYPRAMRGLSVTIASLAIGCSGGVGTESGAFPTSFGQADDTTIGDPSAGPTTTPTTGETDAPTTDAPTSDASSTDTDSPTADSGSGSGDSDPTSGASSEDPTDEPAVCGDAVAEGIELCDGGDLAGTACTDLGYAGGVLACAPDCADFDISGCLTQVCGNGIVEADEGCDGASLDGATCESLGFDGGALICNASCTFDTSDCFASDGMLVTVRVSDGMLRALDPETLAFTDIGLLGVGFDFGEVAWDTTNSTLWMIDGRPTESLFTVDIDTGAASLVGLHGIEDLFGLAHDPTTNTLYGSGESPTGLYTMSTANGAPTFVGDPAIGADGLTYDTSRGHLVALAGGGGTMFSMNGNASVTVLSDQGFINNCGLAYDPVRDLLWAIDWSGDLFSYDPNAAYVRTLELNVGEAHDGFTFVPGLVL